MFKRSLSLFFIFIIFVSYSSFVCAFPIGNYSAIYALGDSLTDMGNFGTFNINAPPCGAQFAPETDVCNNTHNPNFCGKVWLQYLATDLGLPLSPSKNGGNNFAVLGAQLALQNPNFPTSASILFSGGGAQGLQIDNLLALLQGQSISPTALVTIWGGSNDIQVFLLQQEQTILKDFQSGNIQSIKALLQTFTSSDLFYLGQGMGNLITHTGAQNFLIISVPDLSLTPGAQQIANFINQTYPNQGLGTAFLRLVRQFSLQYGQTQLSIARNLATIYHLNIYFEDSFALLDETVSNLQEFGFIHGNDTDWCKAGASPSDDPSTYVFFNDIHPSSKSHFLLSQDILNCGRTYTVNVNGTPVTLQSNCRHLSS